MLILGGVDTWRTRVIAFLNVELGTAHTLPKIPTPASDVADYSLSAKAWVSLIPHG